MHCVTCHGPEGHGDGSSAATLKPPPRDFAARPWRFSPTLESIRKVTRDGIVGTSMPGFRLSLSSAEIDSVAAHVLTLSTEPPIRSASTDALALSSVGFVDLRGMNPPPLALSDARGAKKELADFRGQLVLLHFWGTGCVHCVQEIPALAELEERYAG